jgi:hypothetical protein
LPQPHFRNVVYLLRDGRDAMVSYRHHLEAINRRSIDFLAMVTTGRELYPCKWHEHVSAWMANPHLARLLVIKYEDLLEDTFEQMKLFCDFCGIQIETSFLRQVCEASSFKNLQKREKLKGWASPVWPREKLFVRRGAVGSYRDEMPPDVLKAFLADAGHVLRQQGYDV